MIDLLLRLVRLFTGVQPRWLEGQPNDLPKVYFANHTSHFDFLLIMAVLPQSINAKFRAAGAADYWGCGKIRTWLAKQFKVILIERCHVTRANYPLDTLAQALTSGNSILIFPEGGRNIEFDVKPFKSGIYYLSKCRPEVDLVPVYIDNANRILPKGEFLPVPFLCSVTFGKPIRIQPDERKNDFLRRARESVVRCAV